MILDNQEYREKLIKKLIDAGFEDVTSFNSIPFTWMRRGRIEVNTILVGIGYRGCGCIFDYITKEPYDLIFADIAYLESRIK